MLLARNTTCVSGRGHWAVYYTSPQSFIITFSYSLAYQPWGLLCNFEWMVLLVECPKVSTTNCNLQKGSFCVSSLGMYTSIYRLLSYPIRSLLCFATYGCCHPCSYGKGKILQGWRGHWTVNYTGTQSFIITFS